ncbi:SRPBCC family protein [Chitinophaga cymbidii]|nr:SRPBCC domain-containing protein [Chitinophaga cymbidii]
MAGIYHQLMIGAPPERIYQAITTREGLAGWWTPDAEAKPQPGSIARFPFGSGYFKEMKVIELKPFELVKWDCIAGADEWIGTTLSFTLESGDPVTLLAFHPEMGDQMRQLKNSDKATLLTLKHDNWKDYTPMFAECSYTWARFLRSLKLLCETGKGRPWPHQHQTVL